MFLILARVKDPKNIAKVRMMIEAAIEEAQIETDSCRAARRA